eukprot:TRINITY_DN6529_c0_g1_i3.p1 TRINITY_DN6529_c0_g1~~TRINITY_DN6529_c0_g1_i3.p1  ORF type:complete len:931 (+),score=197.59 TRINITY_DN6529_c0_g1_i3:113-2794(+)
MRRLLTLAGSASCAAASALRGGISELPVDEKGLDWGGCVVPYQDGAYSPDCQPGTLAPKGKVCQWYLEQGGGYSCENLGNATCDKSGTGYWNGNPFWSPQCHPNPCTGGPLINDDKNANYDTCTKSGYTGQKCNPQCLPGSHLRPPGYFVLNCDKNGHYDTQGAQDRYPDRKICQPDNCGQGPQPEFKDPQADYSRCSARMSGDTCRPDCKDGWHLHGDFVLRCTNMAISAGGGYNASGAWCEPNKCEGGPYTAFDNHANYSSCLPKRTGDTCLPTCAAGYAGSGDAGFQLVCLNNGARNDVFNAHGWSCAPKTCKGGPKPGTNGHDANFDNCNQKYTGDRCSPECSTGYGIEGGDFILVCDGRAAAGNSYNASNAQCTPNSCTKGPKHKDPTAVFDKCNANRTGDWCFPKCVEGYILKGGFKLVCEEKMYEVTAEANMLCVPGPCSGGPEISGSQPKSGSALVQPNWDGCNRKHTGDLCNPECGDGFAVTGGAFHLMCVEGHYKVAADIGCARQCSKGPLKPDPHGDYDECNANVTGDMCTPRCAPGWRASGSFQLECVHEGSGPDNEGGSYDASSVYCSPNPCTGGPRSHMDQHAEYADCERLHSGDQCTPNCPMGFEATGSIALVCELVGNSTQYTFNANGMKCKPGKCYGGPERGVDPTANYTLCDHMESGQVCIPGCTHGFHSSGNVTLVCNYGSYDASGAKCIENQCQAPRLGGFPGYVFGHQDCTYVKDCLAGIQCAPGHVQADRDEGGINLACPVDGGPFLPTGCSEVACPPGATRCTGVCACDAENGYEGYLHWDAGAGEWQGHCNHTEAAAAAAATAKESSCTRWWLWLIIILLILLWLGTVYYFTRKQQTKKPKQTASARGPGESYGSTDQHAPGDEGSYYF